MIFQRGFEDPESHRSRVDRDSELLSKDQAAMLTTRIVEQDAFANQSQGFDG